MARPNMVIGNEFINLGVASFSPSAAAAYPQGNMLNRESAKVHTRTGSVAPTTITLDLEAAQNNIYLHMEWLNFTNVQFLRGATAGGSFVSISSETIQDDPNDGVYRHNTLLNMSGQRFLRIVITGGVTDGASYYRIGTIAVSSNAIELDSVTDVTFPVRYGHPKSHLNQNKFPGGRTTTNNLSPSLAPMTITFSITTAVLFNIKGDSLKEVTSRFRDYGKIIYIFFNIGESWQGYLIRLSGEFGSGMQGLSGQAEFNSFVCELAT